MRSTKHFADPPNQSPQSSNHCADGGGEKTSNFYCVRSFDFLLITSYYKSAIGSCIHLLLGVEKYTLLLDSNSGAKNITGSKGTAIYPKQNLNKPVSLPGPFVYFSCGHPCLSTVRGWIYHQHRELTLNIPFIQHPDARYQIHTGTIFQGLKHCKRKCSSCLC